jgi:GTP cyclohydrolase II
MIVSLGNTLIETRFGQFTLSAWYDGHTESYTIHTGNLSQAKDVPVRIHSSCISSHYFNGTSCDCTHQMSIAQKYIQSSQIGLIVVLQQEAKANGILATLSMNKASSDVNNSFDVFKQMGWEGDARDYRVAASVIKTLGIASIVLLSNSPKKRSGLESYGVIVSETKAIKAPSSAGLDSFYEGKRKSEGHLV